jgi:hypothetical protein
VFVPNLCLAFAFISTRAGVLLDCTILPLL